MKLPYLQRDIIQEYNDGGYFKDSPPYIRGEYYEYKPIKNRNTDPPVVYIAIIMLLIGLIIGFLIGKLV